MSRVSSLGVFAVACAVARAPAAEFTAGQIAMGTVLEVTVVAPHRDQARSLAQRAVEVARRWEGILTTWQPQGELAKLNAAAGSGPTPITAELALALHQMLRLHRATGGAFDPAVGKLVDLWRAPAPSLFPRALAQYRSLESALALRDGEAQVARETALDAGGIGKGIALDAIARMLRSEDAQGAFLDFGGSTQLAISGPSGRHAWRVLVTGVKPGSIHGQVVLRDRALSTSRALGPGAEAGPCIDPRTGRPVEPPRLATTLASDAATADAWSTALVVLGRAGLARAKQAGVEALVEDRDGVERTPGFPLEAF